MVVVGVDAHKHSHTVVAVDELGRKLGEGTLGTTTADLTSICPFGHRGRDLAMGPLWTKPELADR